MITRDLMILLGLWGAGGGDDGRPGRCSVRAFRVSRGIASSNVFDLIDRRSDWLESRAYLSLGLGLGEWGWS